MARLFQPVTVGVDSRSLRVIEILVKEIPADGTQFRLQGTVMIINPFQFPEADIRRAELIFSNVVLFQKLLLNKHVICPFSPFLSQKLRS